MMSNQLFGPSHGALRENPGAHNRLRPEAKLPIAEFLNVVDRATEGLGANVRVVDFGGNLIANRAVQQMVTEQVNPATTPSQLSAAPAPVEHSPEPKPTILDDPEGGTTESASQAAYIRALELVDRAHQGAVPIAETFNHGEADVQKAA